MNMLYTHMTPYLTNWSETGVVWPCEVIDCKRPAEENVAFSCGVERVIGGWPLPPPSSSPTVNTSGNVGAAMLLTVTFP